MDNRRPGRAVIVAGALVLAAIAFSGRAAFLSADPPRGLSISQAPYTDEGLKYYQARNRVLFGHWTIKTPFAVQGHLAESPVPNVLGAAVFAVFGPGRVQARMISVTCGTLSCVLLFLIGVRSGRPAAGFLAGLFMATDFCLFSYDRLALFESPTIFFCLVATWAYLSPWRMRIFVTALFLVLAYFTRITGVVAGGALVAAWMIEKLSEGRLPGRRRAATVVIAVSCVLVAAVAVVTLMGDNQIVEQMRARFDTPLFKQFPAGLLLADFALQTFSDAFTAGWTPLLLIAAFGGAVVAVRGLGEPCRSASRVFLIWFLGATVLVAFLEYRPTRYYVLMMPAACYLAAVWITDLAAPRRATVRGALGWSAFVVVGLFAAFGILTVVLRFSVEIRHELFSLLGMGAEARRAFELFVERWFIGASGKLQLPPADIVAAVRGDALGRLAVVPATAAALFAAWMALGRLWGKVRPEGLSERVRLVAAVLVAVVIIFSQAQLVASSLGRGNRQYRVLGAERSLLHLIGSRSDACIGGNWAPTIAMGTPYFVFPLAEGNGNAWDTFKRFPVTHLVLAVRARSEGVYMRRTFAREMEAMEVLAGFEIDEVRLEIYSYVPDDGRERPAWPFSEEAAR